MDENNNKSLSDKERKNQLRLIRCENVGPVTFHKLMERYLNASEALQALPELARLGGRAGKIKMCSEAAVNKEIDRYKKINARLIACGEPDYPPLLTQLEDAPPLISAIGHAHLLKKRSVAIVGSRNASVNGKQFAQKIAYDLGKNGLLVVSGMARGIDGAAHLGAIHTGTVAVLGGGVDVIYPKENQNLYQQISESGVIISEVPPGTQPKARHFPARNRIISGMSRGIIVVEAAPRSGSLITARLALEQGRDVFAVPGSALDPRAKGSNDLIRQGAILTESADDVIRELKAQSGGTKLEQRKSNLFSTSPPIQPSPSELKKARSNIIEALSPTPTSIDAIIRSTNLNPGSVAIVLLELELAGRLERHPGNQVSMIISVTD